jgi:hypothetical protein
MQHRKGWIAVSRRVFSMMEDGARLRNGDPEVVRLHLLRRHGVSAGGIDTYDYLPDLRGRTVAVPSNKICTLHWRDTEGKANVKIQLRCPPDSAGVAGCTLWFEDRGISLCRSVVCFLVCGLFPGRLSVSWSVVCFLVGCLFPGLWSVSWSVVLLLSRITSARFLSAASISRRRLSMRWRETHKH